jgi:hypothetical protein
MPHASDDFFETDRLRVSPRPTIRSRASKCDAITCIGDGSSNPIAFSGVEKMFGVNVSQPLAATNIEI